MNTKDNIRGKESQIKIKEAFLSLLEHNEFQKITVTKICQNANIHRSTFYEHYEDIYDLMRKIEVEITAPIRDTLVTDISTPDDIFRMEILEQFMYHTKKYSAFYRIFYTSAFYSQFMDEASNIMLEQYTKPYFQKSGEYTEEEMQYQYAFCKAGFFSVIRMWLESDCTSSVSLIAGLLEKVFWKCLK